MLRVISVYAILGLVLVSFAMAAIQAYFWCFDDVKGQCYPRPEATLDGMTSLWSIWSWVTELLVFGFVPVAILFINILVIVEIRRIDRRSSLMHRLSSVHGNQSAGSGSSATGPLRRAFSRQRSANTRSATTLTLLALSFYLIGVTLPVTLCYVLFFVFPEGSRDLTLAEASTDPVWLAHLTYVQVRVVVQEIGMSHYACNFYIYLATGLMFRQELLQFFRCCRCRKPSRSRGSSHVVELTDSSHIANGSESPRNAVSTHHETIPLSTMPQPRPTGSVALSTDHETNPMEERAALTDSKLPNYNETCNI